MISLHIKKCETSHGLSKILYGLNCYLELGAVYISSFNYFDVIVHITEANYCVALKSLPGTLEKQENVKSTLFEMTSSDFTLISDSEQ